MNIQHANIIIAALGLYFAVGFLFSLAFVSFGVQKIDPAARGMPLRAHLLILPGVMALWPLMVVKWARQTEPPLQ